MANLRTPTQIDTLFIHCSATPNGRFHTAVDIDDWHRQRGFQRNPELIGGHAPHLRHIGYHFVIRLDGQVEFGRQLREVGAHVTGHNTRSIGICLIGTDRFTSAQWRALRETVEELERSVPNVRYIRGHREVAAKTCPGFRVADWLADGRAPLPQHLLLPAPASAPGAR